MVKGTYLYREFMLRLDVRRLTQQYYDLKEQGLHTWATYDEHKKSIKASFAAIRRSLKRYKDRRIKAGFFYMYSFNPKLALRDEPYLHYAAKRSFEENRTDPPEQSLMHKQATKNLLVHQDHQSGRSVRARLETWDTVE